MTRQTRLTPGKREGAIISALKKKRRAATRADIAAMTTIPLIDVEQTLTRMLHIYRGQLKVTESGEILYYFPHGFRDARSGLAARTARAFRKVAGVSARVGMAIFKGWIMVMLIGYFVLFVALLVAAVVASIAASVAGRENQSRSRGRGGGFGMFYLTTRLLQSFFFLWMYSSPKKQRKRRTRPLHQSVFAFVFGEGDPNREWDEQAKRAVLSQIRRGRGVVTDFEVASLTGLGITESQDLLHTLMLDHEGSPEVTEDGTLYYHFPALMARADERPVSTSAAPDRAIIPFNRNPPKTNRWIGVFNGFNLLFGGYFLSCSLVDPGPIVPGASQGLSWFYLTVRELLSNIVPPEPFLLIGLGIVPVAFAVLFFGITLLRSNRDRRKNAMNRLHNFRRDLIERIVERPRHTRLDVITPEHPDSFPKPPATVRTEVLADFQENMDLEISTTGKEETIYDFPELDRRERDLASLRAGINPDDYRTGEVIYDSGADIPPLEN